MFRQLLLLGEVLVMCAWDRLLARSWTLISGLFVAWLGERGGVCRVD